MDDDLIFSFAELAYPYFSRHYLIDLKKACFLTSLAKIKKNKFLVDESRILIAEKNCKYYPTRIKSKPEFYFREMSEK